MSGYSFCSSLRSMNGPTNRVSMCVRMKHLKASSGVQTIGSPRTLKLVLMISGVPVRS